jgi:hypothetical protein
MVNPHQNEFTTSETLLVRPAYAGGPNFQRDTFPGVHL